jgi:long-chain acyl-CoA synthetase
MRGPADILPRAARLHGERPALITDRRTLSYQEIDRLSSRLAAALVGLGAGAGCRVSILAPNSWEWVVAYHGILKAGAVVNPLNVMLTADEIAFALQDCGSAAILTSADRVPIMAEIAARVPSLQTVISFSDAPPGTLAFTDLLEQGGPRLDAAGAPPDSLSTIGYTSGTTGRPKGAMQSHRAVLLNCALTAVMHVRTEHDVVVTALPAPHVYGNVVINGTFLAGGTVVLMERFDAERSLDLIARYRATLFEGVPAMYSMLLASPGIATADLSSVTRCTVGGQTMAVPLMEEWEAHSGASLVELWGMTELSGLGTTHPLYAPNVHGSIGVALPGIEVRVGSLENRGVTAPIGEPGELLVRGPLNTLGYFGNDSATAELIDAAGWLHTGDVARADANGHFYIVDRIKDMIICGGNNVYPAEIERVVAQHPAVAMVGVGRQADEVKGELACAYVVLRPGAAATEAGIIEFCRHHLAAYKLPRSVRFVPDLPRTSSGKIMRRLLAESETPALRVGA